MQLPDLALVHAMRAYVKNEKKYIDLLNPEDNLSLPTALYKIDGEIKRGLYADYDGDKAQLRYPTYEQFYDMVTTTNKDIYYDDVIYYDGGDVYGYGDS